MNRTTGTARTLAQTLGVLPTTVSNWRHEYADFPEPIGVGKHQALLYDANAVIEWAVAADRYDDVVGIPINNHRGGRKKDRCRSGLHSMEDPNLYYSVRKSGHTVRFCRACMLISARQYRARQAKQRRAA